MFQGLEMKLSARVGRWLVAAIATVVVAQAGVADDSSIRPVDAINYVGQFATVCGIVASAKYATGTKGQPTFLNLDKSYPNQIFTAVIWGSDRDKFGVPPEKLEGKRICVAGNIALYRGRPEIVVSRPGQITMK